MSGSGYHIGHANLEAVRTYFLSRVGVTNRECAKALGLSEQAVGRHIATLRQEWLCAAPASPAERSDKPRETDKTDPSAAWRGMESAPRDGTEIVFINRWRHCSDVLHWREAYDKHGVTFPGRYETLSGHSTGANDDIAWLFWIASPLPSPPEASGSVRGLLHRLDGEGLGASRTESTDAPRFAAAEDAQRKSEGRTP